MSTTIALRKVRASLLAAEFPEKFIEEMSPQICAVDDDGLILSVNPSWDAFSERNGYSGDSFVGLSYLDVCTRATGAEEQSASAFLEGLLRVLDGQKDSFTSFFSCHYPGGKRWYRSIVHRCGPNLTGVMHVDVTEDVENAREAIRVLANARLLHDMKTPIQSISGNAELALVSNGDGETVNHLQKILTACDYLTEMVDGLLATAAVDLASGTTIDEPISISDLLRVVVDEARSYADREKVTLHGPIVDPKRLTLLADNGQLRRAVTNLVSNGIKYNQPGGAVWISASLNESNGIELSIRDNGVGMNEGQVALYGKAFERFDAGQTGVSGSGLGASVVVSVVQAHDGVLAVESYRGEGTSIKLIFPRWRTEG